ncbi:MAG: LLM class flavin-dependent oxidoreductase [Rhodospirillales bacterium]
MIINANLKLSALDQSPIRQNGTVSDALKETIELAQVCDKAGYHRYWLAEHHASDSFAGSTPEIMIGQVANATKKIRVGSGGVMLSHYSPLKVAETFSTLETLFPGRIDLGIGRAPGSDQITAMALGYGSEIGIEYFPTRIADMLSFIGGTQPPTEIFKNIKISPKPETIPELWLLGSSGQSAQYAAEFGLAFTFAQFIAPNGGQSVIQNYIKHFQCSPFNKKPKTSLCVFITCAETEQKARHLARSRDLVLLKRSKGERGPYPSSDETDAYPYTEQELKLIEYNRPQSLYGDPDQCVKILSKMANDYQAEELVVLTICHDPKDRIASYELLANAFNARKN